MYNTNISISFSNGVFLLAGLASFWTRVTVMNDLIGSAGKSGPRSNERIGNGRWSDIITEERRCASQSRHMCRCSSG